MINLPVSSKEISMVFDGIPLTGKKFGPNHKNSFWQTRSKNFLKNWFIDFIQ